MNVEYTKPAKKMIGYRDCKAGQVYQDAHGCLYFCCTSGMVKVENGALFHYEYYTKGNGIGIVFFEVEAKLLVNN